jgi:hypothetical protein
MTVREFVKYLEDFPYQDATIIMASDEEGNSYFNVSKQLVIHTKDKEFFAIIYPCYPEVEIYDWGE